MATVMATAMAMDILITEIRSKMRTFTDWHTHILPGMDDGSRNTAESLEMLLDERDQGVTHVVLTPHYYAYEEAAEDFLGRRAKAYENLGNAMAARGTVNDYPELILGAEVYVFEGLSRVDDLKKMVFRIDRKRYIMLEMPFESWNGGEIREVRKVSEVCGARPVLAHVERYLNYRGNRDSLDELIDMGALPQMNAENFRNRGILSGTKLRRFLNSRGPFVFGSDCHNMENRRADWSHFKKFMK